MAKKHGARQQKKVARQKARRAQKRTELSRRTSSDPTLRLKGAEVWPVHQAWVSKTLWDDGIGYLALARLEPKTGGVIFATYMVDVYCLGVKNTLWDAGSPGDFRALIRKLDDTQPMVPIQPECLAKIVLGAVDYARSFGFPPHHDFRHAGLLLAGIDPAECSEEFTFGKDGKPFYIQGPNETLAQAFAISQRIAEAGGHYIATIGSKTYIRELDDDEDDDLDDDEDFDDDPTRSVDPYP